MNRNRDPKRMAMILREALAEKNIKFGQGEALDVVARQFGLKDWNVLAAEEKALRQAPPLRTNLILGWAKSGYESQQFDDVIDETVLFDGYPCLRLKSKFQAGLLVDGTSPMVTLMQTHENPSPSLGKRVTFSTSIRCLEVERSATIWLRIDGPGRDTIAFNNLEKVYPDGALSGDEEWVNRQITFDVPENTHSIAFGFMLTGAGTAWFASPSFGEAKEGAQVTENKIRIGPNL